MLPPLYRVRQRPDGGALADPVDALRAELADCGVQIAPGARIAVAVGSRGIVHLAAFVREVVAWVTAQGGVPFLVPAMGSHGGATAEGQRAVLAGYGVTHDAVGAPIHATMEVIELPRGAAETPVYLDREASRADGIVLLNRIKPHTSFHGPYESGLMKMLAIGLGKQRQAEAIHRLGIRGLREVMPQVARQVLASAPVLLGIGIVENARDETREIRAIPAADIPAREPALLEAARRAMPRLPLAALDLLIVDEIGKHISGLGMDTNVIGRLRIPGQPEPEAPRIGVIFARDLGAASHGNACGVGLADIITRRLYAKIDLDATYENVLTTGFLERGKLPLIAETDARAVEMAVRALKPEDPAHLRVARIHDTLRLEYLHLSARALETVAEPAAIEVLGPVTDIFDTRGELCPLGEGPAS